MEYLIGAILGGAIALIGARIGGCPAVPKNKDAAASVSDEPLNENSRSEDLLRQWNNLLRYCGKEQHDDN